MKTINPTKYIAVCSAYIVNEIKVYWNIRAGAKQTKWLKNRQVIIIELKMYADLMLGAICGILFQILPAID